jgi:preprotein translocase subunit Sec63
MAVIIIGAVAGYLAVSLLIDAVRRNRMPAAVREPAEDEVTWARRVLGIEGYIDAVGLKHRYHDLLAQYHPDKTNHLGPEIQQLASGKTTQIIRAFEILRSRIQE